LETYKSDLGAIKDKIAQCIIYLPNLSYLELHCMTIRDIDHLIKTYTNKVEKENNSISQKKY